MGNHNQISDDKGIPDRSLWHRNTDNRNPPGPLRLRRISTKLSRLHTRKGHWSQSAAFERPIGSHRQYGKDTWDRSGQVMDEGKQMDMRGRLEWVCIFAGKEKKKEDSRRGNREDTNSNEASKLPVVRFSTKGPFPSPLYLQSSRMVSIENTNSHEARWKASFDKSLPRKTFIRLKARKAPFTLPQAPPYP